MINYRIIKIKWQKNIYVLGISYPTYLSGACIFKNTVTLFLPRKDFLGLKMIIVSNKLNKGVFKICKHRNFRFRKNNIKLESISWCCYKVVQYCFK